MRLLIHRVSKASVNVEEQTISSIGKGLLILLGIGHGDGDEQVTFIAEKVANLRIFEDEQGKTNVSIFDMKGEAIVDRFPKQGKGAAKMVIFADAVGYYDKENKRLTVNKTDDLIGTEVWAEVFTETKDYKGRPQRRSVISFNGYEPIDTHELPGE